MSLSTMASTSYLGAVTLKSSTSATAYSLINKYLNQLDWKDPVLIRSFIASFTSSAIAELLMTSKTICFW